MSRFLCTTIFLTGCFAEPPVDDMKEPVGESSGDVDQVGSDSESTGAVDDLGESTGSFMSSCPDDAVCVVAIVTNDAQLHDDIDAHDYACPAPPIHLVWLDKGDVMTSVSIECDEAPTIIEMPRAPNGWRTVTDGCVYEELDVTPMCEGSGTCPLAGPEPGDIAVFTIPRPGPC